MKCEQFKENIYEYLEGAEDSHSFDIDAFHKHNEECAQCRQYLENEKQFQEKISQIEIPAPTPGFAKKALRNAVKANKEHKSAKNHTFGFVTGFASAMAVFVIVLLIYINVNPANSPGQTIPEVEIALFEPKDVNLVFNVPNDFEGATLSMELSKDYELVGYPNQSKLEWQTNLSKGQNFISLPVISTNTGSGILVAKIKYGDKEKVFKLNLLTIDTLSEGNSEELDEELDENAAS